MPEKSNDKEPVVALIGEFPPPGAGMAVQAEQLLKRFQQQSFPIIPIRTNSQFPAAFRWLDSIRGLRGLFKWFLFLIQCTRIFQVNIIHIFSSSGLNYILFTFPPIFMGRILGKKIIINYHGGAAEEFFTKHPMLLKWSMKFVDELVVPSAFLQKIFSNMNQQAEIVPNIANVENFHFKNRESFSPLILSARNLTNVYNVKCAIDALSIIVKFYSDAKLLIAGDGPEKSNLIKQASLLGLEDKVVFMGNVDNEKMPQLYDQCDIFINTSNIDNMPGSILEAYASGLPVVSTNVGGIPYLVDDGISGLLTDADDAEGLAKHILYILDNPDTGVKMVAKGREKLLNLKWERVSKKWLEIYQRLS